MLNKLRSLPPLRSFYARPSARHNDEAAQQKLSLTFGNVPTSIIGGLPIACLDLDQTSTLIIDAVRSKTRSARPLYHTSANGEVIARYRSDPHFADLMKDADLINADGQSMVFASRLFARNPLPERVATTDLFDLVAAKAERNDVSFYLYGATEEVNQKVCERTRLMFPHLRIVGRSHGFLQEFELEAKIAEINALGPDILWIAMGVPLEQRFVRKWSHKLTNVGLIKTSGGLFDFLSGTKPRAPNWVQSIGCEWVFRICHEPRRLFWRYLTTSPVALIELIRSTQ